MKAKFPTKFRLSSPNAELYAQSFPEDVRNELSILRDLHETKPNVDYVVCKINKVENGFFYLDDGGFLAVDRYFFANSKINANNKNKING